MIQALMAALSMAGWMFWQVGWSLVLGFLLSALIQVLVSSKRMESHLGRSGPSQIAWATVWGAASSSCSYAAASVSRSLFAKGAGLVPTLAFLFASTNLVVELGLVLWMLMGWQFTLAEWLGGMVLIGIMAVLVHWTCPPWLIAEARQHAQRTAIPMLSESSDSNHPFIQRIRARQTWPAISRCFVRDVRMLWQDLLLGFLIAGCLSAWVPVTAWQQLFWQQASPGAHWIINALIGPLVAVISFVCSIGNVPMAAVLWQSGVSFGGVLSFLYADLIVLPLLDVYRRYFGLRMAIYMTGVFYTTMVVAGMLMEWFFQGLGWVPERRIPVHGTTHAMTHQAMSHANVLQLNHTFWLNLIFTLVAVCLWWLSRQEGQAAEPKHACSH